jgi:hypothetical protein
MIMAAVVLMIMLCLIHSFLVSTSSSEASACLCRFIVELSFYPASCENGRKLEREKLWVAECGNEIVEALKWWRAEFSR